MANQGEAKLRLTAQDDTAAGFNSALRSANKFSSGIKSTLGAFTGFLGVSAGISAIVRSTAEAESSFANLQNAVKNNAGAAGESAAGLAKLATELQRTTTYSDEAIQGMQGLLLRFRQIGGPEFQRAERVVLDISSALGKDLSSSATLVGRALADPVKGMTALSRAGVVFSAQQQNTIKSLAESGNLVGAQQIILKGLEDRYKGAAEAARNNFAGALTALKNVAGDLLEAKSGLPELTKQINGLTDSLGSPEAKDAADSWGSTLIAVITSVGKAAGVVLGPVKDLINTAKDAGSVLDNKLFDRPLPDSAFKRLYGVDPNGTGPQRRAAPPRAPVDDKAGWVDLSAIDRRLETMRIFKENIAEFEELAKGREDNFVSSFRHSQEARKELLDIVDAGIQEGISDSLADGARSINELTDATKTAISETTQSVQLARDLSTSLFQNVSGLLESAGKGGSNFADNLINSFRRILADQTTARLFQYLGNLGTSMSGKSGTTGGGFSGFIGGALSSLFGGYGGKKAKGGPLEQGKWYIAGEHGEEPVWGGGSGAFAMGYGRGGGGGGVVINSHYDLRGSTAESMRGLPAQLDQRDQRLKEDIITGIQRGKYRTSRG